MYGRERSQLEREAPGSKRLSTEPSPRSPELGATEDPMIDMRPSPTTISVPSMRRRASSSWLPMLSSISHEASMKGTPKAGPVKDSSCSSIALSESGMEVKERARGSRLPLNEPSLNLWGLRADTILSLSLKDRRMISSLGDSVPSSAPILSASL